MQFVLRTVAEIAVFTVLSGLMGARAEESLTSAGGSPASEERSLVDVQKSGGDPSRPGHVRIEFYGHNAFKITSPTGLTILTDPWRNDPTGRYPKWFLNDFPALRVDVVLSTHAHFDHDAVERANGRVVLERLAGQVKLGDVEVTGLPDIHQCDSTPGEAAKGLPVDTCPPRGVIGFPNAIQIIATGGLRIAVWGDNRAAPDPFLDHYLRDVDVLILPVDTILTRGEVDAIAQRYDPKAIIPAHYFVDGLTTKISGLESAAAWVHNEEKTHHSDVRRLGRADLTLDPDELKGAHHRVYYFGNHFAEK